MKKTIICILVFVLGFTTFQITSFAKENLVSIDEFSEKMKELYSEYDDISFSISDTNTIEYMTSDECDKILEATSKNLVEREKLIEKQKTSPIASPSKSLKISNGDISVKGLMPYSVIINKSYMIYGTINSGAEQQVISVYLDATANAQNNQFLSINSWSITKGIGVNVSSCSITNKSCSNHGDACQFFANYSVDFDFTTPIIPIRFTETVTDIFAQFYYVTS